VLGRGPPTYSPILRTEVTPGRVKGPSKVTDSTGRAATSAGVWHAEPAGKLANSTGSLEF
jgi:hypothetical protein